MWCRSTGYSAQWSTVRIKKQNVIVQKPLPGEPLVFSSKFQVIVCALDKLSASVCIRYVRFHRLMCPLNSRQQ